jgi:hypothetical protein
MFTSLDGARSSSMRPTGGMRPIQFEKRISRKKAAKIGMYGFAVSPAMPRPKLPRPS